jgi:hypothetical protein
MSPNAQAVIDKLRENPLLLCALKEVFTKIFGTAGVGLSVDEQKEVIRALADAVSPAHREVHIHL